MSKETGDFSIVKDEKAFFPNSKLNDISTGIDQIFEMFPRRDRFTAPEFTTSVNVERVRAREHG